MFRAVVVDRLGHLFRLDGGHRLCGCFGTRGCLVLLGDGLHVRLRHCRQGGVPHNGCKRFGVQSLSCCISGTSNRCIPVVGDRLGRFGILGCPVHLAVDRRLCGRFGILGCLVHLAVDRRLCGRFGNFGCPAHLGVGRRLCDRCVLPLVSLDEQRRLRQSAHPCPMIGQCEQCERARGRCFR